MWFDMPPAIIFAMPQWLNDTGVIALWICLMLINAVGVVLTAVNLPGNWLILLATAVVAWWRWEHQSITVSAMLMLLGLAMVGELLELLATTGGARGGGAGKKGMIGALIGSLVGAVLGQILIPIPLVGLLIGACLGAAVFAMAIELGAGRTWRDSGRAATGAAMGRLAGTVAKVVVGVAMWTVALVAMLWP